MTEGKWWFLTFLGEGLVVRGSDREETREHEAKVARRRLLVSAALTDA